MGRSLFDEIRDEKSGREYRCQFGEFFRSLSAEDRQDLATALRDGAISGMAILRVLRRRGYEASTDTSIARHRSATKDQCATCLSDPQGVYASGKIDDSRGCRGRGKARAR